MYLYGASGHGKVVAEIAELNGLEIKGFIDENTEIHQVWDYPVLHEVPADVKSLFLSVGTNQSRKKIYQQFQKYSFPTLIHPNAFVSQRAILGQGTVVMASATINPDTHIGNHVILNTNCSIDHECKIGDFVHISPNAALAGDVHIGEGTQIGIGASVIQGIRIGKWAMIGAGAVIIHDVPDYAVVVGNPGRIIKWLKD
ncbi:MAG: acetyltransferase [Weeksellaceae bacterium]